MTAVGSCFLLLITVSLGQARGAETPARPGTSKLPIFTEYREAAALAFVGEHHRELRPLLRSLKMAEPDKYRRAIRELFADSEQLAELEARDPKLHEIAVQQWKVNSQLELLAARQMGGTIDPATRSRLEKLLREQAELEVRRARYEIRRVELRLEKRKKEIDQKASGIDRLVEARLKRLLPDQPDEPSTNEKVGKKKKPAVEKAETQDKSGS